MDSRFAIPSALEGTSLYAPLRDALPAAVAKIRYLIDLNDFSGPKSA